MRSPLFTPMRSLLLLLFLTPSFCLSNTNNSPWHDDVVAADEESFVLAGYLPDYRAYIDVNSTALYLTDLMLFSLTPESVFLGYSSDTVLSSPKQSVRCSLSPEYFDLIRKARAYKKDHQPTEKIRLLFTVGGGGRSNGFHELLKGSENLQRQFINALVDLCRDEDLNGIDFNFEGIQSIEEWNAYLTFLSMASTYLHRNNLIIAVALHPGQFLSMDVCQILDRVHVMTYDMMPPPQSNLVNRSNNHHASLQSTKEAISQFIKYGCHPSKLVLGIPAYGRHEKNTGLVRTYSEIVDDVLKEFGNSDGDIKNTIQSIQFWNGFRFDSLNDVREKVKYAIKMRLGGIFLWELGQDKQLAGIAVGGILLEEAAATVHGSDIGNDASKDEL